MECVGTNNNYNSITDGMIEDLKKKSRINDLSTKDCRIKVLKYNRDSLYHNDGWVISLHYPTNFKDVPNAPAWFSSNSPLISDPYEVQCAVDELRRKLGPSQEDGFLPEKIKNYIKTGEFFVILFLIIVLIGLCI
jgi:hypothetical protein